MALSSHTLYIYDTALERNKEKGDLRCNFFFFLLFFFFLVFIFLFRSLLLSFYSFGSAGICFVPMIWLLLAAVLTISSLPILFIIYVYSPFSFFCLSISRYLLPKRSKDHYNKKFQQSENDVICNCSFST